MSYQQQYGSSPCCEANNARQDDLQTQERSVRARNQFFSYDKDLQLIHQVLLWKNIHIYQEITFKAGVKT